MLASIISSSSSTSNVPPILVSTGSRSTSTSLAYDYVLSELSRLSTAKVLLIGESAASFKNDILPCNPQTSPNRPPPSPPTQNLTPSYFKNTQYSALVDFLATLPSHQSSNLPSSIIITDLDLYLSPFNNSDSSNSSNDNFFQKVLRLLSLLTETCNAIEFITQKSVRLLATVGTQNVESRWGGVAKELLASVFERVVVVSDGGGGGASLMQFVDGQSSNSSEVGVGVGVGVGVARIIPTTALVSSTDFRASATNYSNSNGNGENEITVSITRKEKEICWA
ncbi:hypothetical protein ScalyP_jg5526 [Parmales sp. scaly parma]|nr:hypothetical protein ScalyP_jg5526 [Parmales sp. scaly parma]